MYQPIRFALFSLVALLTTATGLGAAATDRMTLVPGNDAVKWQPGGPSLPKGTEMAVLAGDPEGTGPFALRVKLPSKAVVAPHRHPTPETLTVLSGDLFHAMGDTLDKSRGEKLAPGGFVYLPPEMSHSVWTESGAVVQVNGIAPFKLIYINPKDDPSNAR